MSALLLRTSQSPDLGPPSLSPLPCSGHPLSPLHSQPSSWPPVSTSCPAPKWLQSLSLEFKALHGLGLPMPQAWTTMSDFPLTPAREERQRNHAYGNLCQGHALSQTSPRTLCEAGDTESTTSFQKWKPREVNIFPQAHTAVCIGGPNKYLPMSLHPSLCH